MKNIIYYFSGTGNSLRAAIGIAERIGGAEVVSVRYDVENISAETAEVIGFVCPVYEWDMPGTMKSFVANLKINPNAYIFMVATYIAIHGKSFETMEKILSTKKAHLNYGIALHCVASQCTAYAPFPPEKLMIPYMEKKINRIGKEISEKKNRAYPPMAWLTRKLYSKLMTPYMEVEQEYDKGFYTDERCVGCEICSRICPTQNITIQKKQPVWNHHCHGCMACVAYCPAKAIQFKTPEAYEKLNTAISKRLCLPEKRKRYHNPFITATDLMVDKQYIESKFDTR